MPIPLPIVRGPLRGFRWLPNSGGKILRVLGGTYEPAHTQRFGEHVRPGDVVFDVGAHVGYYTLLASRAVGATGTVVSFEASPRNAEFLRRHCKLNRLQNVHPESMAVADLVGSARFAFGRGSGTGGLAEGGEVEVEVTTLDAYISRHGSRPNAIKIDVEGAEARVLEGARGLLTTHHPTLFLSTHGDEARDACWGILGAMGYEWAPMDDGDPAEADEWLCRGRT